MKRIFVASVLPFVSAFLGGVLAYPAVLDAQNGRIRMQSVTAESATIVGADTDRIQLGTQWEGRGGIMNWFAPDGVRRLAVGTGGINVEDPEGSGINIYAADGNLVARLGTGHGPLGTLPLSTSLFLFDQNRHQRIRLSVAENGTPVIQLLDAAGNVIWHAP
jgi:hypothetical protein